MKRKQPRPALDRAQLLDDLVGFCGGNVEAGVGLMAGLLGTPEQSRFGFAWAQRAILEQQIAEYLADQDPGDEHRDPR